MNSNTLWVGLVPGDKNPFRRSIRDEKGNVTRVLRFTDDFPIELSGDEYPFVRKDIGHVLCLMDPVDDTNESFRVNWDATNAQFKLEHGYELPSRPNLPVNVGLDNSVRRVVDDKKKSTAKAGGDENDTGDVVDLSDELLVLIDKHADVFVEATPDGVRLFLENGGDLEALDGFTPELADELRNSVALGPDLSRLVGAGIDADLAQKLGSNVKSSDDKWLLDPDTIRVKVNEGFDLTELDEIGKVAARKIKAALGV